MKEEKLIKKYLQNATNEDKTPECPDEQVLLDYLHKSISQEEQKKVEKHICRCSFCLEKLSIASESLQNKNKKDLNPIPKELINKTKNRLGITQKEKNGEENNKSKKKEMFYLGGTVIFFILSFIIPQYFLQFLAGAVILGIRWSFQSKNGKTLIMIIDSWRRHSREKDEQISNRLKGHFQKKEKD